MLDVVFRVDASLRIGTGHVVRCLALADGLRARGARCEFVSRAFPGDLAGRVASAGHGVHLLPWAEDGAPGWRDDAAETAAVLGPSRRDVLVVDHYGLDARWETSMRSTARVLMAVDDLADRPHDVDLLLDQGLDRTEVHYRDRVPAGTRCLLGPGYALLRPEFARLRDYSLSRRASTPLRQVLVSMGGVDLHDMTGCVLDVLAGAVLPEGSNVMVVMGGGAPAIRSVRARAKTMPFACEVLVDIDEMAQLLADSDLAIGAAGGSSWERCALGVPSVVVVIADNQRDNAIALARTGAATAVLDPESVSIRLREAIVELAAGDRLPEMSRAASGLADGCGVGRVVERLAEVVEAVR